MIVDILDENNYDSSSDSSDINNNNVTQFNQNINGLQITLRAPTLQDYASISESQTPVSHEQSLEQQNNDTVLIEELPIDEVDALASRVKDWDSTTDITKSFNIRDKSLPPPTSYQEISIDFPPKENLEVPDVVKADLEFEHQKELKILRWTPEGNVSTHLLSRATITFSQPMCPIASLDALEDLDVPVEISPKPLDGRWLWLGTKTLAYEPKHRFNGSTTYVISIKQGVTSMNGGVLQKDFSFSFTTPPLSILRYAPNYDSNDLSQLIGFIEFNQRIDPNKVIKYISIQSKKTATLITADEVKSRLQDERLKKKFSSYVSLLKNYMSNALPNQHVFFLLNQNFNNNQQVNISINQGFSSEEGPNCIESPLNYSFYTYPNFRILNHNGDKNTPYSSWNIYMSNNIDEETFDLNYVKVTPSIPYKLEVHDSIIIIFPESNGNTNYTVSLSASIMDIFGQSLIKDQKVNFHVGQAKPQFRVIQPKHYIWDHTLSQNDEPIIEYTSLNIWNFQVQIYEVEPEDYIKYQYDLKSSTFNYYENKKMKFKDLKRVGNLKFNIDKSNQDVPVVTKVPLEKMLKYPKEKLGHLLVHAFADKYESVNWVQCSKLALDAIYTYGGELITWVNSMIDGSSIKNCIVSGKNLKGITDENGLVQFNSAIGSHVLIAQFENDKTLLPDIYVNNYLKNHTKIQVFDDRGLYRPKEEINFKGFVRNLTQENYTYKISKVENQSINWKLKDSRGTEYLSGACLTNEWGSFHIKIDSIPDNVNLGVHSLIFSDYDNSNDQIIHNFNVQEFRTPEFKISVSVPPKKYVVGSSTIAKVRAQYYSGGSLSGAETNWEITQSSAYYYPPGFGGFEFGGEHSIINGINSFKSKTDDSGNSELAIQFDESARSIKDPINILVTCYVKDLNYQTLISSSTFTVHPSTLCVGFKKLKNFITLGQAFDYNLVVCDLEGNEKKGVDIIFTLKKLTPVRKGLKFVDKLIVVEEKIITFKSSNETYSIDFIEGGNYQITAQVEDSKGRLSKYTGNVYVAGGNDFYKSSDIKIKEEAIKLVANQSSYKPGDTAHILVQSPIRKSCEGLLVISKLNVIYKEKFELDSHGFKVLNINITDEFTPKVVITVYLVGNDTRIGIDGRPIENPSIPLRPGFGRGSLHLFVSTFKHKLKTNISIYEVIKPGSNVPVQLAVHDYNNQPVKDAEITLVVVDEAVLSLTDYSIEDPISLLSYNLNIPFANSNRNMLYVKQIDTTAFEKLENILHKKLFKSSKRKMKKDSRSDISFLTLEKQNDCIELDDECEECGDYEERANDDCDESSETNMEDSEIKSRNNMRPIAAFIPGLITNSEGKVETTINFPDNLTEYRVTAVSVHGHDRFGLEETNVQAQLPIAIRPSLPRFLNVGDKNVEFVAVIQNQLNTNIQVKIASRIKNLKRERGTGGYLINLPPGKRARVSFPLSTISAGDAKFQCIASVVGGKFSDAVTETIPVYTPSVAEAFSTYGEIDEGAMMQAIQQPQEVFTEYGGLKISTSSTAIGSLKDCFLYIYDYQYLCSEQLASRLISIVSLYDILQQFKVSDLPKSSDVKSFFQKSLDKLSKMQKSNGGFGFWDNSDISIYNSVHVAHALIRCANDGKDVPNNLFRNSIQFILNIKSNLKSIYPYHSIKAQLTIRAYALYVLSQMKEKKYGIDNKTIAKQATELYYKFLKENYSDGEGLAWVCSAIRISVGSRNEICTEILRKLSNQFNETARTAMYITQYSNRNEEQMVILHSSLRTDAIILDMLLTVDENNAIIPKFVKGLDERKKKGRFNNTQENVFALIALRKYFEMFETYTPDFTSRVWIGGQFAGESTHQGRNTEIKTIDIPMIALINHDSIQNNNEDTVKNTISQNLILYKEGVGRMYYRLGLTYAPRDLNLDAASYGFNVSRKYIGTTPNSVKQLEDGTWVFVAGELITVKISFSNDSVRYHVAMVDKLPSGLEIVNSSLIGQSASKKIRNWWWWRNWYVHENLRTERAEAFTEQLSAGVYEYSYICRATACGEFFVPPCQIEEMYSPEIFGRSKTDRVIIKSMES